MYGVFFGHLNNFLCRLRLGVTPAVSVDMYFVRLSDPNVILLPLSAMDRRANEALMRPCPAAKLPA